jgi:hypothetical protein
MREVSARRKLIGYAILGILVFGISVFFIFKSIFGYSTRAGDDVLSAEEEQKLIEHLKEENLPINKRQNFQ